MSLPHLVNHFLPTRKHIPATPLEVECRTDYSHAPIYTVFNIQLESKHYCKILFDVKVKYLTDTSGLQPQHPLLKSRRRMHKSQTQETNLIHGVALPIQRRDAPA